MLKTSQHTVLKFSLHLCICSIISSWVKKGSRKYVSLKDILYYLSLVSLCVKYLLCLVSLYGLAETQSTNEMIGVPEVNITYSYRIERSSKRR